MSLKNYKLSKEGSQVHIMYDKFDKVYNKQKKRAIIEDAYVSPGITRELKTTIYDIKDVALIMTRHYENINKTGNVQLIGDKNKFIYVEKDIIKKGFTLEEVVVKK